MKWVEDSYNDVFYTMNPAINPRDPLEGTTRVQWLLQQ